MHIYTQAAVEAYQLIVQKGVTPVKAWDIAVASATQSEFSRNKICPKQTFLGLAYAGYLKDVDSDSSAKGNGILRQRAISAANIVLDQPSISKKDLTDILGHADQQGSYEIVIKLVVVGIIQKPK